MGKVSLCVKKNHRFVDYPLLSFVTPLCRVRRLCGVVPSAALWRWCCWLPLSALLEFVMSVSSLPEALVNLRREVLALELEARDLRDWGRPALAVSVEREARNAQARFEKAALAYKSLGLL